MSEPITLHKGTAQVTVVAPSEAQRLLQDGWTVGALPDVTPEPVEPEPQFDVPKRGRKAK